MLACDSRRPETAARRARTHRDIIVTGRYAAVIIPSHPVKKQRHAAARSRPPPSPPLPRVAYAARIKQMKKEADAKKAAGGAAGPQQSPGELRVQKGAPCTRVSPAASHCLLAS